MVEEKGIGLFCLHQATLKKVSELAKSVGVNVVAEGPQQGGYIHIRIQNPGNSPIMLREKHQLLKSVIEQFALERSVRVASVKRKERCGMSGIISLGLIIAYFVVYTCIVLLW